MYQHRANVTPPPVDLVEAHTRAKFAYYRNAEAGINAGPAQVTYNPQPISPRRKVAECGTHSGWKRHILDGTEPDRDCLDARANYMRRRREATRKPVTPRPAGVFNPSACGTHNGYERHRRNHSTPCEPCQAAHTEYHRAYRAERRAS